MHINKKDLEEFRAIHFEEFGECLSDDEVSEMSHRLIHLYLLLARKLPSEQNVILLDFSSQGHGVSMHV